MVDLNKPIYNLLKGIAKTQLEFPSLSASFPIITFAEISNISEYEVENEERISDITYQIDVWDNGKNRAECEEIALKVSAVLTGAGFTRVLGRGLKDPSGLIRKTMYFKTKAINEKER